jgi:hypothetical protein
VGAGGSRQEVVQIDLSAHQLIGMATILVLDTYLRNEDRAHTLAYLQLF